jgi:hypothetical protein
MFFIIEVAKRLRLHIPKPAHRCYIAALKDTEVRSEQEAFQKFSLEAILEKSSSGPPLGRARLSVHAPMYAANLIQEIFSTFSDRAHDRAQGHAHDRALLQVFKEEGHPVGHPKDDFGMQGVWAPLLCHVCFSETICTCSQTLRALCATLLVLVNPSFALKLLNHPHLSKPPPSVPQWRRTILECKVYGRRYCVKGRAVHRGVQAHGAGCLAGESLDGWLWGMGGMKGGCMKEDDV